MAPGTLSIYYKSLRQERYESPPAESLKQWLWAYLTWKRFPCFLHSTGGFGGQTQRSCSLEQHSQVLGQFSRSDPYSKTLLNAGISWPASNIHKSYCLLPNLSFFFFPLSFYCPTRLCIDWGRTSFFILYSKIKAFRHFNTSDSRIQIRSDVFLYWMGVFGISENSLVF